jgi:hypothetical protein
MASLGPCTADEVIAFPTDEYKDSAAAETVRRFRGSNEVEIRLGDQPKGGLHDFRTLGRSNV